MNKSTIIYLAIGMILIVGFFAILDSRQMVEKTEPVGSENPTNPTTNPTPVAGGGCFVGGCSNQICSDQKDMMSTCEYKEEYACYKTAKCERQTSGQCGWTQTSGLTACLTSKINLNTN